MSHSYKALKNKDTVSAQRLRQKIESAKTSLFNNKYWPAKSALDSATDVVIHPHTGAVLTADVGLEFPDEGKMVVTGVNMRAGTVSLRRYANMAGGKKVTVPMSELSDAKPYKFDAGAEADEVNKLMEASANEKLNSLTKWEEVKAMPSAVLEKNHDLIQRQIKDLKASYKGFSDLGDAYMVHKETGKIEKVPSYETSRKHETHDYLLPTDGAKEKAIQAWVEARRGATLTTDYVQRSKGRGSRSGASDRVPRRNYKDAPYTSKHINPMQDLLRGMDGGSRAYGTTSELEKQAKARLVDEQIKRIRRAPSATDAIAELMPMGQVSSAAGEADENGYAIDGKAVYPRNALAMAWARARHLGELDAKVETRGGHSDYAYGGGKGSTVHGALIRMARVSGHAALAEAFAETAERHSLSKEDAHTLQALGNHWGPSSRTISHFKKVADRMGILDKTMGEIAGLGLKLKKGPFDTPAMRDQFGRTAWDYDSKSKQTMREVIDENMSTTLAREASMVAKEAA